MPGDTAPVSGQATGGVTTGQSAAESQQIPAQGSVTATAGGPATEQQVHSGWKVGDTVYEKPEEMAEAFRKLHGAFTQRSQELSRLKTEYETFRELAEIIRSDPKLATELQARLKSRGGEQAGAEGNANLLAHPEIRKLYDSMDQIQRQLAQERFEAAHPDLDDEVYEAIANYIQENASWLDKSGLSYDQILDISYNAVFRSRMAPKLLEKGQKMAEQAIQKGRRGSGVSAPAASAAVVPKPSKPYAQMSPAEKREYAMAVYKAHAKEPSA